MLKRLLVWLFPSLCDHADEKMSYEAEGVDSQGRDAKFGIFLCKTCERVSVRKTQTDGFIHG